jgi:hypothetical protein
MRFVDSVIAFDALTDTRQRAPGACSEQAFEIDTGIGIRAQWLGVTRRRLKSGRAGFMIAQFEAGNKMGE